MYSLQLNKSKCMKRDITISIKGLSITKAHKKQVSKMAAASARDSHHFDVIEFIKQPRVNPTLLLAFIR